MNKGECVASTRLASNVSIVSITHNRSKFMKRLGASLEAMSFGGHLIIAESSDDKHMDTSRSQLSKINLDYKLTHLHVPKASGESISLSMNRSFKEGISRIDTKYAMLTCDDDVPVPVTLEKCARFLDENPDFNGANGEYAWYDLDRSSVRHTGIRDRCIQAFSWLLKVENVQGRRRGTSPSFGLNADSAATRLEEYLEGLFHTMFVVVRSETLNYIVPDNADQIKFPHFVADYNWMFAIAMAGKIKHFKQPQVIRQFHGRNLSIKDENHPFPTYLESMLQPSWGDDSRLFVSRLAGLIEEFDGEDTEVAKKLALDAFRKLTILRLGGKFECRKRKVKREYYFYVYALSWSKQCQIYSHAVSSISQFPL